MDQIKQFIKIHFDEIQRKDNKIRNQEEAYIVLLQTSLFHIKYNQKIFDWQRYINTFPDLRKSLRTPKDAIWHYLNYGIRERRKVYVLNSDEIYEHQFNWKDYITINQDLRFLLTDIDCFEHYITQGYLQNRQTTLREQIILNDRIEISENSITNKNWLQLLTNNLNNLRSNQNNIHSNQNNIRSNHININEEKIDMFHLKSLNTSLLDKINSNITTITNEIVNKYKNILFVCGDYPGYGGAATNCYHLQQHFKKYKINTFGFYFNFEKGANAKYEKNNDYVIDDIEKLSTINFKPDLIILKSPIKWNLKQMFGCPVYYLVGGIYKNELNKYYYNIVNKNEQYKYHNEGVLLNISRYDKIYVNSSHTQQLLLKWYNLNSNLFYTSFIPYYNEKLISDPQFNKRKYEYGLIVSNFDRKIKNIDDSIRFLKGKKNVILIGKGSSKYKSEGVNCIELVNMNDMKQYYKQIKYIVQDSYYESCSNVKIESLFNGCKISDYFDTIPICNNMQLSEIKNGLTWIHGDNKNNILITIYIISIEDHQLQYCLNSVNKLNVKFPVLVNVIQNIYPTNKAYDEMRKRCYTSYFIQLDEDMQLFPNAIETIYKTYDKSKFLNIYRLYDDYLGVTEDKFLYGVKLYNQTIMKNFETLKDKKNNDVATSAVDRNWHKKLIENGYEKKNCKEIIGYHEQYRKNFDLFIKYSKITNNLLTLNKNSGSPDDICRLLIPINTVKFDYTNFIKIIINHYMCLFKNKEEKYRNNIMLLNKILSVNPNNIPLKLYNITGRVNRYIFTTSDINFNVDTFFKLFDLKKDHNSIHKSCISGIINTIFDNYAYSFDKYPYKLFEHLDNFIGKIRLTIISHELPNFGGSASNSYAMFKYYQKKFDVTCIFIDSNDYFNKIEDKEAYLNKYADIKIIYKNEDVNYKLIEYIQKTDVIVLRNPQSPDIMDIDFNLLKLLSNKIISIFGGGLRNIYSRKIQKIPAGNIILDDYSKNFDKNAGVIDYNTELLQNEKIMKVIELSDHLSTNTYFYNNIFKEQFKNKYIGYYDFSSINKFNFEICNYKNPVSWNKRKVDIIFLASSLTRTQKAVVFFLDLVKDLPYNVLIIGNKMIYKTPKNVTHIPFTNNVDEYLINSKLLIMTSLFEASSNTLFEGVNAGCNILTSNLVSNDNTFKQECIVSNFIDKNEWIQKIHYLLKNPINSLRNRKRLINSINEFSEKIEKMDISQKSKLILIVAHLNENYKNIDKKIGRDYYLLADNLIKLGYNVFFLTNNVDNVTYTNNYYYINFNQLTPSILSYYSYIYFTLNDEDNLISLIENTDIVKNILKVKHIKNKDLKIICNMFNYPKIIDKYHDSYDLFDRIILNSNKSIIPGNISRKITNNNNQYNFQQIMSYCNDNQINNKFYSFGNTSSNFDYKHMIF